MGDIPNYLTNLFQEESNKVELQKQDKLNNFKDNIECLKIFIDAYKKCNHINNETVELQVLCFIIKEKNDRNIKCSYTDNILEVNLDDVIIKYKIEIKEPTITFNLISLSGIGSSLQYLKDIDVFQVDIDTKTNDVDYRIEDDLLYIYKIDSMSNLNLKTENSETIRTIRIGILEYNGRLPLTDFKRIAPNYESLVIKNLDNIKVLDLNKYSESYYPKEIRILKSSVSELEGTIPNGTQISIDNCFLDEYAYTNFKNLKVENYVEEFVESCVNPFISGEKEIVLYDKDFRYNLESRISKIIFGLNKRYKGISLLPRSNTISLKTRFKRYRVNYKIDIGKYSELKMILFNYMGRELKVIQYRRKPTLLKVESVSNDSVEFLCPSTLDPDKLVKRTILYPQIKEIYDGDKLIYKNV